MSTKLTVEPAPFKDAVEICERIASRAVDMNQRVARVSVGNGRLTISATDKARFYERRMPVQGRNCSFCIEIAALSRVAKTAADADPIEISVGEAFATFSFVGAFGKGTARASIMSADDFSKFPDVPENPFVMERDQLLGMLRAVLPCADRQNPRGYFNGITMALEAAEGAEEGKRLVFYGCNVRVLALCSTPAPMGCEFDKVIIPTEAVDQFESLCHQDASVGVAISENLIAITGVGFTFMSRLIGETPPEFRAMMPAEDGVTVEADGTALSAAVKSVTAWSGDRERCVWLVPEGDSLRVCCRGADNALSTGTIPAAVSGDAAEFTIEAKTLSAALAAGSGSIVLWVPEKGAVGVPPGYRYSRPDAPAGTVTGGLSRMRAQPWATHEASAPVDPVAEAAE